MSVWLTPDLKPFVGGTYFPPEDRYGQPGFPKVLQRIAASVERGPREDRGAGCKDHRSVDEMRAISRQREREAVESDAARRRLSATRAQSTMRVKAASAMRRNFRGR